MPHFLAVYTMTPESLARFRALPQDEQDAVDAAGLPACKTMRVTRDGVAPASNDCCGYVVVEADSIEAAARLFEGHPHFTIFPGDGVDIMPFLTGPASCSPAG